MTSSFPERLKLLRDELGLTQQQLGEKLNVSDATINRYERGQRNPDPDTLNFFADLFEVSVDYLLGRSNTPHLPNVAQKIKEGYTPFNIALEEVNNGEFKVNLGNFMTKEELIFIQKYKQLPPSQRKAVETLVEQLSIKDTSEKKIDGGENPKTNS